MAASDALRITLHGHGGHGSSPHTTIDPVVMAASTVMKLQTIVSRGIDPGATAVVTVGTLHAGTKENIIPDSAVLTLSIRSFEPTVRDRVLASIEQIAVGEAASYGAPKPPDVDTIYSFLSVAGPPIGPTCPRPYAVPSGRRNGGVYAAVYGLVAATGAASAASLAPALAIPTGGGRWRDPRLRP